MLRRTFVHIPSIGYATERKLWNAGVASWDDARSRSKPPQGFGADRWALVRDTLDGSEHSLRSLDHRYFAGALHPRDHWRAFPDFCKSVAYLDIETDGLGDWAQVTVVGVFDGLRTHTYVAGDNLDQLAEDICSYSLLVTFNGATFDLPFLCRRFGNIFDHLHIDLRFALMKLGYSGGLKSIERKLGVRRAEDIADISGEQAVWLWREYQRGSREALDLLVEYNRADVVNLEFLMQFAYERLWQQQQFAKGVDA